MNINLGFLIISLLAAWKLVDLFWWALSAGWREILGEWFK